MYGTVLVSLLALIGGLIALIGDRIGMKVGRKRLSLFGLRPKHTSMVVTVCTGIVIAAASLTILAAASSNVRTALFHMEELRVSLARSEARLDELARDVGRKQQVSEALARQIGNMIRQGSLDRGAVN